MDDILVYCSPCFLSVDMDVGGFLDDEAVHSIAEGLLVAVPFEMLMGRPVSGVCGERDFPVLHICQQVGGFAGFGKVPVGNEEINGG